MNFATAYVKSLDHQSIFTVLNRGCPHCGEFGFLVGHGRLLGYSTTGEADIIRGKRIFCSGRGRKKGCGRTFSILLADRIRRHSLTTTLLWIFFAFLLEGVLLKQAWPQALQCVRAKFTLSTGYKLRDKVRQIQSSLRVRLCRLCPPPRESNSPCEVLAVLAHLREAFAPCADPPAEYQSYFQRGLLDPT